MPGKSAYSAWAIIALALMCGFWITLVPPYSSAQSGGESSISVHPNTPDSAIVGAADGVITYPAGAEILPINMEGVENLGAATILVGFNPMVLAATGCQRNTAFDVGLCNIEYDGDDNGQADGVLFNIVSLQGIDAPLASPMQLVEITWEAQGIPAGNSTTLEVTILTFTDTDGVPLAVAPENGLITIIAEPTATATPTISPTPTASPIPTKTPTPTDRARLYMPLLVRQWMSNATPVPPLFTCSDWCSAGNEPNRRRQAIGSDRPVSDWRMYAGSTLQNDLFKETQLSAIAEAELGVSVRIDALYQGQWLRACKSIVACSQ